VGRPAVGELEREGVGERVGGMESVGVLSDDCKGDREAEGQWDEEDVIDRDAGGEEPKGEREGKPLDSVALVTGEWVLLPSVLGDMGPEEEGKVEGKVEKDREEEVEEDSDTDGVQKIVTEDERESEGLPLPVLLTEGLTVWDPVMEGEGVAEVERHTLAVRVSFPTEPEAHMVGEDVRVKDTVDVVVGAGVVAPGVAETVEVTEAARAVAVPGHLLKEGLLEPHFDTVGLRDKVAVGESGIHFSALGTYVWSKAQRG
jgi:hypothetical protein